MVDATPKSEVTPQMVPTLKKRSDFLRLRSGRYKHTPLFIVQTKKRDDTVAPINTSRAGYTVTTKTGNSVERSRIKRRLREAVRQIFPQKAKRENDYVIIAKRAALTSDFSRILKELSQALDHVHGYRANDDKRSKNKSKSGR